MISRQVTKILFKRQFSGTAFPSLVLSKGGKVIANGQFAMTQQDFLFPDTNDVDRFKKLMVDSSTGIVAHFYMNAQLQGIINKCNDPKNGQYVTISDSLAMGDEAVKQAKLGIKNIAVLGVEFMVENVRAFINKDLPNNKVNVFKVDDMHIGCSLAESAERLEYQLWLEKASKVPNSAHVIYINTSLRTKNIAQQLLPTITCTSSNVVQTILQIMAQNPEAHIFYGPDTYMGENIVTLLSHILHLSDDQIKEIHPAHNKNTILKTINRFNYYKSGICIVHHMFGSNIVRSIKNNYWDCYVTAHFEVPGEMFELALAKKRLGMGEIGSTSQIINYIVKKVKDSNGDAPQRFILGTESGMTTKIVDEVIKVIGDSNKVVEIIFPVANEAFTRVGTNIIPGVPTGEGCSISGGCATCKYMNMNDIDKLENLLDMIIRKDDTHKYLCRSSLKFDHALQTINTMREFQKSGKIPLEFIDNMQTRLMPFRVYDV